MFDEEVVPIKVLSHKLSMTQKVHEQIHQTIGQYPAETGGILGGDRQTGLITSYYFDEQATETGTSFYTPNTERLNTVLKTEWKPQGIAYLGSIHSHPSSFPRPSGGDELFAKDILEALKLPFIFCPVVATIPDTGSFTLFPYAAVPVGNSVVFIEQELSVVGVKVPVSKKQEVMARPDIRQPVYSREFMVSPPLVPIGLAAAGLTGMLAGYMIAEYLRELQRMQRLETKREGYYGRRRRIQSKRGNFYQGWLFL